MRFSVGRKMRLVAGFGLVILVVVSLFTYRGSVGRRRTPEPEERRRAALETPQAVRSGPRNSYAGYSAFTLAFLLGILAAWILWRETSARRRAEEKIRWLHEDLEKRISERTAALAVANEKLSNTVIELESRSGEIGLLSEMADILQTCVTPEEAYTAIARTAPRLFPNESGVLGVIAESRNCVEVVASWGDPIGGEHLFAPGDCWALRRGRPHLLDGNDSAGMLCRHLGMAKPGSFLCVPMVAQGEALGVLHVQRQVDGAAPHAGLREDGRESHSRLAVALAEQIALALANLRLRESLRLQAIRDPLTGLFNRRHMEESLERELRRAARSHLRLGLIMLDLDDFKSFNDLYGHVAGDALLREVANFLRSQVRGEDIACRYGGDEFVLILPEASLEASVQRAELLRKQVKHLQVTHQGRRLGQTTLSFGVSLFPRHGRTVEALLSSADQALYRAKAQGRDCGKIADPAAPQLGLAGHLSAVAGRKHA